MTFPLQSIPIRNTHPGSRAVVTIVDDETATRLILPFKYFRLTEQIMKTHVRHGEMISDTILGRARSSMAPKRNDTRRDDTDTRCVGFSRWIFTLDFYGDIFYKKKKEFPDEFCAFVRFTHKFYTRHKEG